MPDDRPGGGRKFPAVGMNMAAFAWGFAEATLFFIVPDVLLTWIALHDSRRAWGACLWALVGAILGGAIMYGWGARDFSSAIDAVSAVPAVQPAMIEAVGDQLHTHGASALFLGPLMGTPYKIYAVQAANVPIPFLFFILVSIPARAARFLLATGLTVLICRLLPWLTLSGRRAGHILVWASFYAWYFWSVTR